MKKIEKSENKIVFAGEMSESLANAIRRSALEIPILAVDEVEFHKNDSVLYDEVLALRLGLVPLKAPKGISFQDKCSCKGKGCSKCYVQLKLVAKGPKTVYAGDLKGKAEVVYPKIPLVELSDGQEVEIVAKAKLGKGIEHTKFSPGLVYYRNSAEIEVGKEISQENMQKCVEECPQKVLKLDKGKIDLIDKYKCDLCGACMEKCDAVKILPGKEIVFCIESWGQIKADEILSNAVKSLKDNLKQVK